MITKTVTYENFDGKTVSEQLHFHINKAELLELEMESDMSFSTTLLDIAETKDVAQVLSMMKRLIMLAYGKKSEDGNRFIKNDRIRVEFDGSEAYSELLFGLLKDADTAAAFFTGMLPKDLAKNAGKLSDKDIQELRGQLESRDVVSVEEEKPVDAEDLSSLPKEELLRRLNEK